MKFNIVIIGCGMTGTVMSNIIANYRPIKSILIIEKRSHIGGNVFDLNVDNCLIHQYGPHIFHTNSDRVWQYLSQFTEWRLYEHKVKASVDGLKIPLPFNLNSLQMLLPPHLSMKLENKLISEFGYGKRISILDLKKSADEDLLFLAKLIYEKIFLNYTRKQWGLEPEEIDPSVLARVPISIDRDDRYFKDKYQGIPKDGYTKMIERMLDHKNIKILLNTDHKEVMKITEDGGIYLFGKKFDGWVIYTGEIDYFFNYKFGKLPYRSLEFKFETHRQRFFQEVAVVNYPNEYDFTRITEFKHITGQESESTLIAKEFPKAYSKEKGDIPYYPILTKESIQIYKRYQEEAKKFKQVIFVGRLAEFKYYNMDEVILRALNVFEHIKNKL